MSIDTPPHTEDVAPTTPRSAERGRRTKYTILIDEDTRAYQRRLRAFTDVHFSDFLRALIARVDSDRELEAQVLAAAGHFAPLPDVTIPVPSPDDIALIVEAPAGGPPAQPEPPATTGDEGFWDD